jgi:4-alpha-glucanotransferase
VSLATSGTHDTETLVEWWEGATLEERRLVAEIPFLADKPINPETTRFDSDARDALIEVLFASSSDFVVIPMQDLFGWRDRVNTPATVSDENWTWRLPWPIDTFGELPETQERAHTLRGWARAYKRSVAMLGGRARRARA